jgi:hypothetical protein
MRLIRTPSADRSSSSFSISGTTALILGLASQMILLVFCVLFSKSSVVELAATYIYADAQADYLWGVFIGLLLTVTVFFWPIDAKEKLVVAFLWQAKLVVCLVLMLFYEAYFIELDAFGYFNTAISEIAQFDGVAIGDGSNNVTEFCKLLFAILPGSYHMLKVLFAYVGLIGIFLFYRTICLAVGTSNTMWLIGLGLFPSILFWSSILGKDPLSFLGIALACYGIINISKKQLTAGLFWLAAGILLVAYIRIWMALILLAPAVLVIALTIKSRLARVLLAVVALGAAAGLLSVFNERFEIESRRDAFERYDSLSRNWSDVGGSSQAIEENLTDPIQLLAFAPLAGFTTLFRPMPFEIPSVFGTLSGLENLLLLVMFWRALVRFRMHHIRDHAIAAGILFIGVWVLLYGPISYQNFGTAVRFKLQILPIFLALLIAIGSKRALGGVFPESAPPTAHV